MTESWSDRHDYRDDDHGNGRHHAADGFDDHDSAESYVHADCGGCSDHVLVGPDDCYAAESLVHVGCGNILPAHADAADVDNAASHTSGDAHLRHFVHEDVHDGSGYCLTVHGCSRDVLDEGLGEHGSNDDPLNHDEDGSHECRSSLSSHPHPRELGRHRVPTESTQLSS